MELKKEDIEAFIKAYKHDLGEDLSYKEAFEIAHRLMNVFLILEKASMQEAEEEDLPDDTTE